MKDERRERWLPDSLCLALTVAGAPEALRVAVPPESGLLHCE